MWKELKPAATEGLTVWGKLVKLCWNLATNSDEIRCSRLMLEGMPSWLYRVNDRTDVTNRPIAHWFH